MNLISIYSCDIYEIWIIKMVPLSIAQNAKSVLFCLYSRPKAMGLRYNANVFILQIKTLLSNVFANNMDFNTIFVLTTPWLILVFGNLLFKPVALPQVN